jgi:hypothetical protein
VHGGRPFMALGGAPANVRFWGQSGHQRTRQQIRFPSINY